MKPVRNFPAVFIFMGIVCIPASSFLFSFQSNLAEVLFGDFLNQVSHQLGWGSGAVYSDSSGMLLLVILLLAGAFIIVMLERWTKKSFLQYALPYLRRLFYYYLAMQLFVYGTDKLFHQQFYQPEPNILYSRFGTLQKDILYWSTMGTSHIYNVFLGLMEMLAALLLLINRTRLIGLLLALTLLCNILMVNISFGITVKIYSAFLLTITLYLLFPYLKEIIQFFLYRKNLSQLYYEEQIRFPAFPGFFLKSFVFLFILFEGLYPFLKNEKKLPLFHGAWEIQQSDSLPSSLKRFYVHRDGFFIAEDQNGEMKDYRLRVDSVAHYFHLLDYNKKETKLPYRFHGPENILEIKNPGKNTLWLRAKPLNWKSLPALQ